MNAPLSMWGQVTQDSLGERAAAGRRAWPGWQVWVYASCCALAISALQTVAVLDHPDLIETAPVLAEFVLAPQLIAACVVLAWAWTQPAMGARPWRGGRLVVALALAVALGMALWSWVAHSILAWPRVIELLMRAENKAADLPPVHVEMVSEFLSNYLFVVWAVLLAQLWQTRRAAMREISRARLERSEIEHRVLEARLASMQAQIEPQFLFDTLVRIEQAYRLDPMQAGSQLERLIGFLRIALPGLQRNGHARASTIAAEIALVEAYLGVRFPVVRERAWRISCLPECLGIRFFPMLLLPMVQCGLRGLREGVGQSGDDPLNDFSVEVQTCAPFDHQNSGVALVVSGRFACPANDDPDWKILAQRISALYGQWAQLECASSAHGLTWIALRFSPNQTER